MNRVQHDRMKWKCRRGLLELDLVLDRFLQRNATGMAEGEVAALNELLEYPDGDLWEVVSGRSDHFDPRLGGIVARLRAA